MTRPETRARDAMQQHPGSQPGGLLSKAFASLEAFFPRAHGPTAPMAEGGELKTHSEDFGQPQTLPSGTTPPKQPTAPGRGPLFGR